MENKELAVKIVELAGGAENIDGALHCVTRLRLRLKDESLADDEAIKSLEGVLGIAKGSNQYQIILGEIVPLVYREVQKLLINKPENNKPEVPKGIKGKLAYGLNVFSEMLTPIVPSLAGAGMLKVVLLLLTQFNILTADSGTYQILDIISDTILYFMPIVVAFFAAERLNVNKSLAVVIVSVLLHPKFVALVAAQEPIHFLGMSVELIAYNGVIIPPILAVITLKYVDEFLEKIIPNAVKLLFKPLLAMVVVSSVLILILGPIGYWIGEAVGKLATLSFERFGWLTVGILGAILPFTVITGLNRALTPVSIQIFTSLGHEPLFRTAYIAGNMTQAGAALAVAFKTKNKKFKQLAYSSGFTTLLSGITEPSIFGVNLKAKRPLIATTIAGFISGAYAGIMGVTAYAMAVPGIFAMPMFIAEDPMNLVHAFISLIIAVVGSFILTLILGFDDPTEEETKAYEGV